MKIQKSTIDDLAEKLALQKLAYQENAVRYNDFGMPPLRQTLDELVSEFDKQTFLKAVVDDNIIGSVRGRLKDGSAFIEKLIVHTDF